MLLACQTQNDCDGVLGGDSPLSAEGAAYARAAAMLIARRETELQAELQGEMQAEMQGGAGHATESALVMTGTLRRYSEHYRYITVTLPLHYR